MEHWSRRDLLRAGLAAGSSLLLPAGSTGCGPRHRPAAWHNDTWTRCIDPERDTSPASLDEIVKAVARAAQDGYRIRAVGAGHSFSDIAVIDGHLIRMNRLNRALALDPGTLKAGLSGPDGPRLVSVEAGMSVREINAALDAKGLALRNMGGWDAQTAGGVISTATHGSGLEYGSSSSFVRSLVLVTHQGKVLQIEPRDGITGRFPGGVTTPDGLYRPAELVQDDDLFQSVVVSMGCMGIIYSVVIEVEPKFWLHEVREQTTWEQIRRDDGYVGLILRDGKPPPEATADGGALGEVPRHYEIYVNPFATAGNNHRAMLVKRFYRSAPPTTRCERRGQLWLHMLTGLDIENPRLATDLINGDPKIAGPFIDAGFSGLVGPAHAQRCSNDVSYRIFNAGDVNRLAAYSVEPAVALHNTIPAMNRLLEMAEQKRRDKEGVNAGPISIRFVQASDAFLSPHHGHPTATLEIQALVGVNHMNRVLRDEERMLLQEFKARPHWGLDLGIIRDEATLRALYPRFDAWKAAYLRLNSSGVFNSQFTDRVGLSDSDANPRRRFMADGCAP